MLNDQIQEMIDILETLLQNERLIQLSAQILAKQREALILAGFSHQGAEEYLIHQGSILIKGK